MAEIDIDAEYDATLVFIPPDAFIRDETDSMLVGCADTDIALRCVFSFDLSAIPAGSTVTLLEFVPTVEQVSGDVSADTWDINGYHLDGSANPQTDSDADTYARCAGAVYINNSTALRTDGEKRFDITAAGGAHAEAVIDAAGRFSVAIVQGVETGGTHQVKIFGESQDPPPYLHVEYEEGGEEPPPESSSPGDGSGSRWTWR